MTKPLDLTNRDMLIVILDLLRGVPGTLESLLGQRRELELRRDERRERDVLIATNRILASRVEKLSRENETLMQMVGRMTIDRQHDAETPETIRKLFTYTGKAA